jgi:hypothetical protein
MLDSYQSVGRGFSGRINALRHFRADHAQLPILNAYLGYFKTPAISFVPYLVSIQPYAWFHRRRHSFGIPTKPWRQLFFLTLIPVLLAHLSPKMLCFCFSDLTSDTLYFSIQPLPQNIREHCVSPYGVSYIKMILLQSPRNPRYLMVTC